MNTDALGVSRIQRGHTGCADLHATDLLVQACQVVQDWREVRMNAKRCLIGVQCFLGAALRASGEHCNGNQTETLLTGNAHANAREWNLEHQAHQTSKTTPRSSRRTDGEASTVPCQFPFSCDEPPLFICPCRLLRPSIMSHYGSSLQICHCGNGSPVAESGGQ